MTVDRIGSEHEFIGCFAAPNVHSAALARHNAALISLVQVRVVPAWMVVIIVGREFAISGLRSIAAAEGYVIQASDLGKTKLVTQVAAVTAVILSIRWTQLRPFALAGMWIVVFFTLVSAFAYFRKFWRKVDGQVKRRRRRELLVRRKERLRRAAEANQGTPIART